MQPRATTQRAAPVPPSCGRCVTAAAAACRRPCFWQEALPPRGSADKDAHFHCHYIVFTAASAHASNARRLPRRQDEGICIYPVYFASETRPTMKCWRTDYNLDGAGCTDIKERKGRGRFARQRKREQLCVSVAGPSAPSCPFFG